MVSKLNDQDFQYVFNLIGKHAELKNILHAVIKWLEDRMKNTSVYLSLYSESEQSLHVVSNGKHVTLQNKKILDTFKINSNASSYSYENSSINQLSVINENFNTDPNWVSVQKSTKEKNMTTCWSTPVINAQGVLHGKFETYYYFGRQPTDENIQLLHRASVLTALAIDLQIERQQRQSISEKYDSFFKHHPDGCFELDLEGNFVSANRASLRIASLHTKRIHGLHYSKWIHPEYLETANSAFEKAAQGEIQYFKLQTHPNTLGKNDRLNLTCLPIIQEKQVTGIFCIAQQDTTTYHVTDNRLHILKQGLSASPNGMILTSADADMPIIYANPAFLTMTGYTEEEVLGRNCRFLQGQDSDPSIISSIREALKEKNKIHVTLKNYRKDGSGFWNKLTITPVLDEQGRCTHFIAIQQDITKQKEQEEYIAHLQTHDSLTNLPNRQGFETQLKKTFDVLRHTQHAICLLYIDLDAFNLLNDSLGYSVGDQLITAASLRLKSIMQDGELLARLAGDEFVVMLTHYSEKKDVVVLVERVLQLLSKPFYIADDKIHITASIGIVVNTVSTQHPIDLLHHSRLAMNEAKRRGRNTWYWYEAENKNTHKIDYLGLRNDLLDALEEKQFKVFYQPIVAPQTGQLKAVEALIRWEHPQMGLLTPEKFIPFAEKTGQIVAIGQWVLRQACMDIANWNKKNQTSLIVAVNISPLQFRRSNFLQGLHQALVESQLPPNLLKIEVIESMLITESDRSLEILQAIRSLGIQIAIDDFGTGHSNLSYLRRLPVNQIKLDRSFIEYLPQQNQDAAIVQTIITLAHQLGLEVVAEGVETAKQAVFLSQNGCDLLQGYHYAQPALLNRLKTTYNPCVMTSNKATSFN